MPTGIYQRVKRDPIERFLKFIRINGDCWYWTGAKLEGYGLFEVNGKTLRAHRWYYERIKGSIPSGLQPDHKCHTNDYSCSGGPTCKHRSCVNPDHIELVTSGVNTLRGKGPTANFARRDRCKWGHEFIQAGLKRDKRGARLCRVCATIRLRKWRHKQREVEFAL